MATITTSMVLLRWPLLSAVMMFLASTLNIQLRKSDYAGLAVISTLPCSTPQGPRPLAARIVETALAQGFAQPVALVRRHALEAHPHLLAHALPLFG